MRKAQVLLREDQKAALQSLSRRTGRNQSELIRHGVDLAIAEAEKAVEPDKDDWRKVWLAAAGIWAGRDDIDEMRAELRAANRRRAEALEKQWHGDE